MWEWRVWCPLTAEAPADITALLGDDIEVEQSEELQYELDASIDLRRVVMRTQKNAHEWEIAPLPGLKSQAYMLLRFQRGLAWTTSIERWVGKSKLTLQAEELSSGSELSERTLQWLAHNGVRVEGQPTAVSVRRRTLAAAIPGGEHGLSHMLLEQSDLEACGRMWRSVCVRGSSPEQVHRYVLSLREHLLSSGLVASNPGFARAPAVEHTPASHPQESAPSARLVPPRAQAAPAGPGAPL